MKQQPHSADYLMIFFMILFMVAMITHHGLAQDYRQLQAEHAMLHDAYNYERGVQ